MSKYRIFETDQFMKVFGKLNGYTQGMISEKLKDTVYPQLKEEPHYGLNIKKLVNWKPEKWRYRIGDYRLFYEINDEENIVYIITIRHRQNAY